jgi:regulator of replication initiation timing
MNIVDMAHQILDMAEENERLRHENRILRNAQEESMRDMHENIRSNEQQMVGWIQLLCSDRVKILPPQEVTP